MIFYYLLMWIQSDWIDKLIQSGRSMRNQEINILDDIQKLEKDQLYLMETPKSPQQQFLHLFAHRHLLNQKMIHKNIDRCLDLLPGTFAQNSLKLAYTVLCVENQIEIQEGLSPLLGLINGWINYYPSLKGRDKIMVGEIILQEEYTAQEVQGYDLYLHYLNLISFDIWKLLKGRKSEEQFLRQRPLKEEMQEWNAINKGHLDASDLLTFVSSCIPKTLLNIILEKASLPNEMKEKFNKFQCLYSNQGVEYYLKTSNKLSLLLKNIFMVLLHLDLNATQSKFLMLVAMRYYYTYHYQRRFSAAEIVIYAFNKLTDDLRKALVDEFSLFIKVVLKLGKEKFVNFLAQNSAFLRQITEAIKKKPVIGYPQEAASPYNTIGIGETLVIDRGATCSRYFEVLQEFSIFYYRLVIENMDVTVRLYYLGEVGSSRETKTLLFTQEKSTGTIKNCINAMKKGLYQFEFDNSYSWINSKRIKFENVVYSPLQIKTTTTDEWIPDFYSNIYQNQIAKEEEVYVVTHKKVEPKKNTAILSKEKDIISLFVTTPALSYRYETDCALRMEQKVIETIKGKEEYRWIIQGQTVTDIDQIKNYLKQTKPANERPQNTERIDYYQEDEQEQEIKEEEYEVVEKTMEQSQIFNEDNPKGEVVQEIEARGEKPSFKKKVEEPKAKDVERTKREEITCKIAETEEFYNDEN